MTIAVFRAESSSAVELRALELAVATANNDSALLPGTLLTLQYYTYTSNEDLVRQALVAMAQTGRHRISGVIGATTGASTAMLDSVTRTFQR